MTWEKDGQLLDVLTALGVPLERVEAGAYLVTLHGTRRPRTHVWLIAGEQDVRVEAFVVHLLPGADTAAVHHRLLRRNLALREVHFGLDEVGDVFLTGSLPVLTETAVDQVLGEVHALLEAEQGPLLQAAYGQAVPDKALLDGAGRRPAGTPDHAPRRDARR